MRSFALAAVIVLASGCAAAPAAVPGTAGSSVTPPRVILFIGDGVGLAYWSAALFTDGALAVARASEIGIVDPRNSDGHITDSAAGATVYAIGERTFNGAIGVAADSTPRETILERAEDRGMATGLVATSSITHATPASFAAHMTSRSMEPEIAAQMAEQGIEVLLGGGLGFFDGSLRPDGRNLLAELRADYTVVTESAELRALALDTVDALLGLFATNNPPAADARGFTLTELTTAALTILDHDDDGFLLVVEASQPDWRGHDNEPIESVVAEMRDFDAAIGAALDYADTHPGTLVVVTADHETGGLAIEQTADGQPFADYTTTGHTGTLFPHFAHGPGAAAFGRLLGNDEVGRLLRQAVDGGVAATSATR